jgi:hypothetical protein
MFQEELDGLKRAGSIQLFCLPTICVCLVLYGAFKQFLRVLSQNLRSFCIPPGIHTLLFCFATRSFMYVKEIFSPSFINSYFDSRVRRSATGPIRLYFGLLVLCFVGASVYVFCLLLVCVFWIKRIHPDLPPSSFMVKPWEHPQMVKIFNLYRACLFIVCLLPNVYTEN